MLIEISDIFILALFRARIYYFGRLSKICVHMFIKK